MFKRLWHLLFSDRSALEEMLDALPWSQALRRHATVVHADAGSVDLPDGAVILVVEHPTEELIDRVLSAIRASPQPLALLLHRPLKDANVLARGAVLRHDAAGTRGWQVWTNRAWLYRRRAFATLRLTPA